MTRSSTRQVNEDRSSPDSSLLPSLQSISPLPITHLYGLSTYLSDWRADRRHGYRPQPPTPARMASEGRRLSTAIPRPSSGTSRRLASIQRHTESCLTPLLSPERARRPSQRSSTDVKSGTSPLSYHLPRSLLPRSESLLTHFEQDRHFERKLESPRVPFVGVPKSQTTPAILSPNKDIASHSLLKPLGPPLPRSNTCNDVVVLQSSSNFPSRIHTEPVKICFEDVMMPKRSDMQLNRFKSPYPQPRTDSWSQTSGSCIDSPIPPLCSADGTVASVIEQPDTSEEDPRFVSLHSLRHCHH